MKPQPWLVQSAMLLTMLLWGVSFVASKAVLTEISPLTYMGIRFLIAAVLMAVIMALRGRPHFDRRTHGLIALTALAEPVAYFLFESYGIRLVSATTASLVIATIPLAVMGLAALMLGEPLRWQGAIAVVVSLMGIALLVVGSGDTAAGSTTGLGILLVTGAVFSAALYITLARGLTQRYDRVNITIVQTWWGSGVFLALWRLQPTAGRSLAGLSPTGWWSIAFLAVGATVMAFLLYNWALRYEEAGRASLYINAIPVVTAVTGWLVLDERLSGTQWIGAILVLVSVRLSSRRTARFAPPEA